MVTRNRVLLFLALAIGTVVVISGCVSNAMIRTSVTQTGITCNPLEDKRGFDLEKGPQMPVDERECGKASFEASSSGTARYELLFVEFDDQGRLHDTNQERKHEKNPGEFRSPHDFDQLSALFHHLEDQVKHDDLSILVFVHGWRHNAGVMDANVMTARYLLENAARLEARAPHPNPRGGPRKVIGIYVGWRGKSLTAPEPLEGVEVLSFFDRKFTAENVASGSVRDLFSRLKYFQLRVNNEQLQLPANKAMAKRCKTLLAGYGCRSVRLVIIGHSFGGLMVYNAISESLIDSITQGEDVGNDKSSCAETAPPETSRLVRSYADLIVLVNPAVEGSRFEPLHQAVIRRSKNGFCKEQRPVFVSITATSDWATRYAFRVGRFFNTIFESTRPKGREGSDEEGRETGLEEREALVNTLGHVTRFQTHNLEYLPSMKSDAVNQAHREIHARICRAPPADKIGYFRWACECSPEKWNPLRESNANCASVIEEMQAADYHSLLKKGEYDSTTYSPEKKPKDWERRFCGGTWLLPKSPFVRRDGQRITRHHPYSPIWNVTVSDTEILDGHSGFHKPAFLQFVEQLYHDVAIAEPRKLLENMQPLFEKHCTLPLRPAKAPGKPAG